MAVSQEYLDYISEIFESLGVLTVTRMFGGALLKVDDKQLGVIISEELYFKVTETDLQERFKKEGSVQFSYIRKDKKDPVIIKNWWKVPEQYLDDQEGLQLLAQEVLSQ